MPDARQVSAFLRDLNSIQARHGLRVTTKGDSLVLLPVHEQPSDANVVAIRPRDDITVVDEVDATLVVA